MVTNELSDLTVVDFAAHTYTDRIDVDGRSPPESLVGEDRIYDPETQLQEMAEAGIDAVVLTQPHFLGHSDLELTAESNDSLGSVIDEHDACYGLAAVPTAAGGTAAAEEFERCLSSGFHGGGIETETDGIALTDPDLEPVFEVATQWDAPLFVHVPNLPGATYRRDAIFGREHALAESIYEVVHDSVFDRYPDLSLVFHHLGGNIANMMGRIHLHVDQGRWPRQEGMKPFAEFKHALENNVYIDTSGYFGYHAPVRIALEEFPTSQVLFGTDYPWEPRSAEELAGFVDSISGVCSATDRRRILGENALKLLTNV